MSTNDNSCAPESPTVDPRVTPALFPWNQGSAEIPPVHRDRENRPPAVGFVERETSRRSSMMKLTEAISGVAISPDEWVPGWSHGFNA
jgi:hypothetical protein